MTASVTTITAARLALSDVYGLQALLDRAIAAQAWWSDVEDESWETMADEEHIRLLVPQLTQDGWSALAAVDRRAHVLFARRPRGGGTLDSTDLADMNNLIEVADQARFGLAALDPEWIYKPYGTR